MNLERYARYEERTIYEVWDGADYHTTFGTAEQAQAYIDGTEYPEEYDYKIIEELIEVKVYDLPERDEQLKGNNET